MTLRPAINLNNLKVRITFPNGESEIRSFRKVQEYALEVKDLNLCPAIISKGETKKGSLIFTLI